MGEAGGGESLPRGHLTIERQLGYLIIVLTALSVLLFDTTHNLAVLIIVVALVITLFAPILLKPLTYFINKASELLATLSKYVVFGFVYFGPISFVGLVRLLKRRASKKKPIETQWTNQNITADKIFFEDMF